MSPVSILAKHAMIICNHGIKIDFKKKVLKCDYEDTHGATSSEGPMFYF